VWLFAKPADAVVGYSTYRLAFIRIALGAYVFLALLALPGSSEPLVPELAAGWLELPGPLRGVVRLLGLALALCLASGFGRRVAALGLVPVLAFFAAYARLGLPLAGSLAALLVLVAAHPAGNVLHLGRGIASAPPSPALSSIWFRFAWLLGAVALFVLPLQGGSSVTLWLLLPGLLASLVVFLRAPDRRIAAALLALAALGAITTPGVVGLLLVLPLWALVLFDEAWVPSVADEEPILFFDGLCVFCNGVVQFILLEEQTPVLRFAPLDSAVARESIAPASSEPIDSIALFSQGRCHFRSDAALRTARAMGGFWGLLWLFRKLPVGLRDAVYDFIAANRYGWFGKLDACPIPKKEQRERFVE
jgi:predicted DCC family thiol-disulfide oxidoreductase YuxK